MVLEQLFNEIKYGKEFVEAKSTIEDINNFIDEDYNIFLVGQRTTALLEGCDNSKSFIKKLARASRNYIEFENKLLEGKTISSVYAKMKMDSIVDDVNAATIELDRNIKLLRESNKEAIAKTIASLDFGLGMLGESTTSGKKPLREAKQVLQAFVNKEANLIKETI